MALAHQAAALYLALYFVPGVLHKDPALMRTLVDRCSLAPPLQARHGLSLARRCRTASQSSQACSTITCHGGVPLWFQDARGLFSRRKFACRHFTDNWVVAWGPGFRSDLAVEWESFKAARSALSGVVTPSRARDQAATYAAALPGLQAQLSSFLLEGKLKVALLRCSRCSTIKAENISM